MFSVRNLKQLRQIADDIGKGYHQFSEADTVWQGDDGSYLIGDVEDFEIDAEDGEPEYTQAGTLGEYATVDA